MDCKYLKDCVYSAEDIYVNNWKAVGSPANCWPYNAITTACPLTEEAIREAIQEGPYGRCVYACDNDVVDNQIVAMTFENGITANLRMTAFTAGGGRIMKFYCTHGQIEYSDSENKIFVRKFNKPEQVIDVSALLNEGGHNHGGGDTGLVNDFYSVLCGSAGAPTKLEGSIESHVMAIRAEQSRKQGGVLLKIRNKA